VKKTLGPFNNIHYPMAVIIHFSMFISKLLLYTMKFTERKNGSSF